MPPQTIQPGQDVTALMGGADQVPIQSGADVTHLMQEHPSESWANTVIDYAKKAGTFVANHPAAVGATALGTVATLASGGLAAPAAMGLVGLASAGGAGLGLAAKDAATGRSAGAVENVKQMAEQGAAGAAGEGAGRVLQATATPAARWLMDRAFNPTDRLAREFPQLSDAAIEHAISVSKGGMEKARGLLQSAKGVANAAIQKADATGATVPLSAATDGLSRITLGKIASNPDIGGAMTTLAKVEREIAVGRKSTLTLTEADALKTQLQREARIAYAASRAPNGTPALAVEAEAKKDMAATLNAAIDAAASKVGASGYAEANAIARDLIGVNRALVRPTAAGPNVLRLMVRPGVGAIVGSALGYEGGHPGVGAVAGALATSPASMSRLAILLGHPMTQQALKQIPRPILAALIDQFQPTGQPDAGAQEP